MPAGRRRIAADMRSGARLALLTCALAAGTAFAQDTLPSPAPTAAAVAQDRTGNLSRAEKRCNAALRRVERHREKLAETQRAIEAHRKTAGSCAGRRACDQASHREKTLTARERREARQLDQLEAEAEKLCAVAATPAGPR